MEVKLFDSELKVMEILWQDGDVSAKHIAEILSQQVGWSKTTTYTVIKRLSDRGIIKSENAIVTSIIKKEDAQSIESVNTIDSRFDGSLPEFVAAFVRARGITDEERQEIVRQFGLDK